VETAFFVVKKNRIGMAETERAEREQQGLVDDFERFKVRTSSNGKRNTGAVPKSQVDKQQVPRMLLANRKSRWK
jgi:hypothetical protein